MIENMGEFIFNFGANIPQLKNQNEEYKSVISQPKSLDNRNDNKEI